MNFMLAMSLILMIDVSGSVDDKEYAIQKRGTIDALMDPAVQRAIWNQRGICVSYMEFHTTHHIVVPWTIVETADEIVMFAERIAEATRVGSGSTNVFGAIMGGLAYFGSSPCGGDRVIDISGDGKHNTGGDPPNPEGELRINALPIMSDEPDLAEWYQHNVVRNGFMMPVDSFEDFPSAIRRKLAMEIAWR